MKPYIFTEKRARRASMPSVPIVVTLAMLAIFCLGLSFSVAGALAARSISQDAQPTLGTGERLLVTSLAPLGQEAPTPVGTTGVGVDAPVGVGTQVQAVPGAVDTSVSAPAVVSTTGPNINPDVAPSLDGSAPPGDSTQTGSTPSTFPLIPVLLALIVALAAAGFVLLRSRRPLPQPVAASTNARRTVSSTTNRTTTMPQQGASPPAFVPPTGASSATVPIAAGAADMTTVQCPNCGTTNGPTENFCHECGEDLRPMRAQLAPAVAPPMPVDEVTEDTPYLETLDRADEQLEYVLSRQRVLLGTAPGNDVVIDDLFTGWETVSPVHAELRREQEGFVVVDRDSQNGTFVNEMRTGENILSDGDVLRLGSVRFVFRVPTL